MTPANLRALRMRLGLGPKDAAELLGISVGQVETMERAKFNNVFMIHFEELARIEEDMIDHIDTICESNPSVLIGYMSTEDMLMFEPGLAPLRSNQVHRMALAEAQVIMAGEINPPRQVDIVEIVPDRYGAFLHQHGLTDSPASREQWAIERRSQFKIIPAGG